MSPASARGTVSMTELSYGLRTSIFWGLSTHWPATYIFIGISPSSGGGTGALATPAPPPLQARDSLACRPSRWHRRAGTPAVATPAHAAQLELPRPHNPPGITRSLRGLQWSPGLL